MALNQELIHSESVERDAVDIVLQTGQVSLHDVYLIHGSNENRSHLRRSDYAIRYMPASTRYVRDPAFPANAMASKEMNYMQRPLWLLRGRDLAGNEVASDRRPDGTRLVL